MKTCSYCGHENQDGAIRCASCGTEFEPAQATPTGDDAEPLIILATFGDTVEASLLKGRLEQAGIEAAIPEELDPSPFGNFPPVAHVTVRVAKKDYEVAKEVLDAPPM